MLSYLAEVGRSYPFVQHICIICTIQMLLAVLIIILTFVISRCLSSSQWLLGILITPAWKNNFDRKYDRPSNKSCKYFYEWEDWSLSYIYVYIRIYINNLAYPEFSIIYNFMDPPWHTLIPQSHFKDKNIDKCSNPFPRSVFWFNKKHSPSRMQDVCSSGKQTAPPISI